MPTVAMSLVKACIVPCPQNIKLSLDCLYLNRFLNEDDDLECPELVLLALDLIINHHEKYLESQEEAQQEAPAEAPAEVVAHKEDQPDARDQHEHNVQAEGTNSECEDHFFEDQPEADRWTLSFPDSREHSSSVKDSSGSQIPHNNDKEAAPTDQEHHMAAGSNKKNDTANRIKGRKKSQAQNCCVGDSVSSASSIYHTLNSDEEASSLGEQTSDWEEQGWRPDYSLDESRETVISKRSMHNSVPEGMQNNKPQREDRTGALQHLESSTGLRSVPSPGVDLCCESEVVHSASITQCVHALLLLCRSSATICRRLHSLGLLSRLLDGFNDLICANDCNYKGEYRFAIFIHLFIQGMYHFPPPWSASTSVCPLPVLTMWATYNGSSHFSIMSLVVHIYLSICLSLYIYI